MHTLNKDKALVLFSGGQDSSIALAWALNRFANVESVGFDYGQRNAIELGARTAVWRELRSRFPEWTNKFAGDTLIDLAALGRIGVSSLTSDRPIETGPNGLPTTFVPGRNLAFLVFAAALAYQRDAGALVTGMCEADYSGYPDCREDAIRAQGQALRLGMDADIEIETPLMHRSKADSWALADEVGGEALVALINEHSHTCYQGVRSVRHAWGYGCGECPACTLRRKGWEEYVAGK